MKYNTGTVSVVNGDATVTGDGTQDFTSLVAGQLFTLVGSGVTYEVAAPGLTNSFELTANYGGASAAAQLYTVVQSFTSDYDIPYTEPGDVQTATIFKRAMIRIDTLLAPTVATTTQLADEDSTVNTLLKREGRQVWNSTTAKPVWATGADQSDVWMDATGILAHTPI